MNFLTLIYSIMSLSLAFFYFLLLLKFLKFSTSFKDTFLICRTVSEKLVPL